jgi:hypothetical protein
MSSHLLLYHFPYKLLTITNTNSEKKKSLVNETNLYLLDFYLFLTGVWLCEFMTVLVSLLFLMLHGKGEMKSLYELKVECLKHFLDKLKNIIFTK